MIRFSPLLFFQLLISVVAFGQTYFPLPITGFNSDLFAETAPNSLATTSMSTDLTAHVMYTQTFAMGAGLPAGVTNNGTIVSGTRTYQLAAFNSQNAVYIDVGLTQIITLFTTGAYSKISLMGFSAEGNSTLNIKLTFTDGTTTNYGNFTLSDWFDGANAVYCCFSRCIRTTSGPYNIDGLPSNPRFYPIDISLSCDDQHKNLQTITIKNMSGTTGFTNAFLLALSGVAFSQNVFSIVNNVTCSGGNDGSINLFTGGTSTPFTFSWNTLPLQTTPIAINLDSGTYICKITDFYGCIIYDTVEVSVLPAIPINVLANPIGVCAGDVSQLTVTGLSGYTWMPGGQTTSPAPVSPLTTTVYTVTGTDGNGCPRTDSVAVNVNPLPAIVINPNPGVICEGGAVVLQAGGASTYTWSPAMGLSNSTIFNPTASPLVTTVYTVTGIAVNSCSNTTTVEVTVNSNPVVVANANPAIICKGDIAQLMVNGLSSFTWSPGGQNTSPINVSPLITTTYTVSGNGSNGCSGESTVTVTVNALPSITITPTIVSICSNDSATLTANGGLNYIWSPDIDLSDPAIFNPVASPATTTIYTVTSFDANGCSAFATSTVTVYPSTNVIALANPSEICEGLSTQLSVSGLNLFTWSPGGQTTSPITITPLTSSIYTVTGTDINGCDGTGTVAITVNQKPIVVATSLDTVICNGTQATMNATGTAAQYTWNPGGYSGNTFVVTPADTTEYLLTGALGNCSASDSIIIKVVPVPDVAFTPSASVGCDPLTVLFTDQSPDGTEWHWQFSDGGHSDDQNPDHTFLTGIWSVTETVVGGTGCSEYLTKQDIIHVYADPVADFTVAPDFYVPVELQHATFQFLNQSSGATDYVWDFGDDNFSSDADPLHSYKAEGNYNIILIATGPANCNDTISKSYLNIIPSGISFIPTAFTPNGDGLNDVFIPANMNILAMEMTIFNRWGNLVFHSNNPQEGWNGTFEGVPAEIGVYIYSISLQFNNGTTEVRKGNLTLVR